jgi:hypothetical protein
VLDFYDRLGLKELLPNSSWAWNWEEMLSTVDILVPIIMVTKLIMGMELGGDA